MKVCVYGLRHLGCVTAACLADLGCHVVAADGDWTAIHNLGQGRAPLLEPGLDALIRKGLDSSHLRFTADSSDALKNADAVWFTVDTPVDNHDSADLSAIQKPLMDLLAQTPSGTPVVLSSQVPVGFCRGIETRLKKRRPNDTIPLCYSPENLRLGNAITLFKNPGRLIAGIRHAQDRSHFEPLFSLITPTIEWMGVESAEMVKHAINSFLAASIVFTNELAVLCEWTGANAKEVEKGLKTEPRIGPRAYLNPGSAFAGGTLARDVEYLTTLAKTSRTPAFLLKAIRKSNEYHKDWAKRKFQKEFGALRRRRLSVFGLSYKPNTDAIHRSWAIDLCRWLHRQGATIQAFDPGIQSLPKPLASFIELCNTPQSALEGAEGMIITTDHSILKDLTLQDLSALKRPWILDPNGILSRDLVGALPAASYFSVGYQTNGRKP